MKVSAKEAWLPPYLHDHMAGSVGVGQASGDRIPIPTNVRGHPVQLADPVPRELLGSEAWCVIALIAVRAGDDPRLCAPFDLHEGPGSTRRIHLRLRRRLLVQAAWAKPLPMGPPAMAQERGDSRMEGVARLAPRLRPPEQRLEPRGMMGGRSNPPIAARRSSR
jgi:hypothetical protein